MPAETSRLGSVSRMLLLLLVGLPAGLIAVLFIANGSWFGFVGILGPAYLTWSAFAGARASAGRAATYYLASAGASVALIAFYVGWFAAKADWEF